MPIALLMAALLSGLTAAVLWLSLGGSGVMAFVIYVLTGQLMIAAFLGRAVLRGSRG